MFSVGTAGRKPYTVAAGTLITAVKSVRSNIGLCTILSMINISQATLLSSLRDSRLPHRGHPALILPQEEEAALTFL